MCSSKPWNVHGDDLSNLEFHEHHYDGYWKQICTLFCLQDSINARHAPQRPTFRVAPCFYWSSNEHFPILLMQLDEAHLHSNGLANKQNMIEVLG